MQFSDKQKEIYFQWQPLILAVVLVLGIIIGDWMSNEPGKVIFKDRIIRTKSSADKVSDVLKYIQAQYVDTVNMDQLTDVAVERIMEELDPHSYYIDRSEIKELNEKTEGDFEGIGIEFMMIDDTIFVIRTMDEGPAEKAGLQSGDQILEAGGIDMTTGLGLDSIRDIVKGSSGSQIDLLVKRKLKDTVFEISVERARIPYHSVTHSFRVDSQTVYVKLAHFNGNAYKEFLQALEKHVLDERIERLIIDLRDNPGGYLQEVVKILSQLFREKEKLLVYTQGRNTQKVEYESTGLNFFDLGTVAVFMNEHSASASEIMAGALQDWERGIVVGRRSFGKGLVQEQFELSDGSAIRLTTAKYHTPAGRMIQRPYDDGKYEDYIEKRLKAGEFFAKDSIEVVDSISFKTKRGNVLYSGKGIIPDIFVSKDSIEFDPFVEKTFKHLSAFIFRDVMQARLNNELPAEPVAWWENFKFNDNTWDSWMLYLNKNGVDTSIEAQRLSNIKEAFAETYRFYFVYYAYSVGSSIELEFPNDPYWEALKSEWSTEGKFTDIR